jgi:hypothetical protein
MRGPLLRGALQTGYRQTKPHIGWMLFENDAQTIDVQTVVVQTGAWSFTWRERPAWKHGHWEHLDVTHETADSARGVCPKFSTSGTLPWNPERLFPACTGPEACTVVGFDRKRRLVNPLLSGRRQPRSFA